MIRQVDKEVIYSFPFCFFLIEYVFGMYFNDVFPSLFSFLDEMLAIILLLWTAVYSVRKKEFFNKEIRVFGGIALFYLFYSFYIKSNIPIAIFADFLIQLKPFIGYFMICYIGITMNKKQKKIVKNTTLLLFVSTVAVVAIGLLSGSLFSVLKYVYGHPTRYGTALILIGLTYLYCSNLTNKKDLIILVVILTFSLFSTRSKIYGIYAVAMFAIVMLRGNIELKFSVKNILVFVILISIAIFIAREKVIFYFLDFNVDEDQSLARPMLYMTSWDILFDYFPFGSGLASFATHYSGVFYSNIYNEYELSGIWGLLEGSPDFVTDTGYPGIAQFGIVGVVLYVVFFCRIIRKNNSYKEKQSNLTFYLISVLLTFTLVIENIGDTAFTSNRGFYIMILMALSLNESSLMDRTPVTDSEKIVDNKLII